MKERLSNLMATLDSYSLSWMLVTKIENVRYLSGFSGSSGAALVTPGGSVLITDSRYSEQAPREAEGWDVVIYPGTMVQAVADSIPEGVKCGFEVTSSFSFFEKLSALIRGSRLEPLDGVVEKLRVHKDDSEVACIRAALSCAARGFEEARGLVRPGVSERELAAELDYRMMLAGADRPAFDTVVASGPNSSLPHAPLTDRKLEEVDLVVLDFGSRKRAYVSDTTRTLLLGEDDRQKEVFETVRGALDSALYALKAGANASEVDAAARGRIADAGFGDYFSHALGHGVGLEAHEMPALSAVSTDILEPGMVFTVEPGIYIPGWGGVRLEEIVLMTGNGPEVLSRDIPLA